MKITVDPATLRAYRLQLPHGTQVLIAKRAGVSRQSVSAFLSGKSYSRNIELATLDIIAKLRKEREIKLRNAGLL